MVEKDLFGNEVPEAAEQEQFELPDGSFIWESNLEKAEEETQIAAMRSWFSSNFQNPAEETPHDSGEGGYQYMCGGPYDAREEIDARFGGIVPDDIRKKLVRKLQDESWEWAGIPSATDYDDYVLEAIEPPSEHIKAFTAGIENIRKLIKAPVDATEQQFFQRLLYASVITALETYLSDRFVSSITNNPKALRKFVETFPKFEKETIKLGDIFARWENLERQVKRTLLTEIVWHRLEIVGKMFTATFDLDFPKPQDLGDLLRAVEIRHDLVHRSGKDKEGMEHTITPQDIEKLILTSNALVTHIDYQNDRFSDDDNKRKDENGGPKTKSHFSSPLGEQIANMISSRHARLPHQRGTAEARAGALDPEPVSCPGVLPEGLGPLPAGERDSHAEADTGACDGVEGAAEDEIR